MLYTVKDGVQTWKVKGILLSSSSSRSPGKPRWVEFQLYRTPTGQYVVGRVGYSLLFHSDDCSLVTRNRLSAVDEGTLSSAAQPCEKCRPARIDPRGVYPETPRYWAVQCETPEAVIASLTQRDTNNSKYLTNVAKNLIIAAAVNDLALHKAFYEISIE
jgi:hypothetical protein